jgi:hypothetical protein
MNMSKKIAQKIEMLLEKEEWESIVTLVVPALQEAESANKGFMQVIATKQKTIADLRSQLALEKKRNDVMANQLQGEAYAAKDFLELQAQLADKDSALEKAVDVCHRIKVGGTACDGCDINIECPYGSVMECIVAKAEKVIALSPQKVCQVCGDEKRIAVGANDDDSFDYAPCPACTTNKKLSPQ